MHNGSDQCQLNFKMYVCCRRQHEKKQEKKLIYNQFAKSFTLFRKVSCADAHDALWMRNQILSIFFFFWTVFVLVFGQFCSAAQSIGYVKINCDRQWRSVSKREIATFHWMISMNVGWQLFHLSALHWFPWFD